MLDRLREQQQEFNEAKVVEGLPDGNYTATVLRAEVKELYGKLKIQWGVLVDAGEYEGKKHSFQSPLEGKGIGLSKKNLKV